MRKGLQQGVTLTELLIGLTILGILAGVGAPSFSNVIKNSRQGSTFNNIIGTLHLARSEAIKRNTGVAVCARLTDTQCGPDWSNGWLLFVDDGATPNSLEPGEEVLRIGEPLGNNLLVTAIGSSLATASAYIVRTNIRFTPRGSSSWRGGGSITLCDDRGDQSMKAMFVSISGDIRRARKDPNGIVSTPWGTDLQC